MFLGADTMSENYPKITSGRSMRDYKHWTEENKKLHRARVYCDRWDKKQHLLDLKGGKCIQCNYSRCNAALEFHHRDPSQKKFLLTSTNLNRYSWEEVLEELDKCDLLCANCHREEEYKQYEFKYQEYIKLAQRITENLQNKKNTPTGQCPICKADVFTTTYCSKKCFNISRRKVERPPKEQLQQDLSEMSVCAVGRKYGVSDNAIRKWLK